jgi:hypothetical protein
MEGVKEHHMWPFAQAVAGGEWREDIRASNWVGVAVAGVLAVDIDDPQAKARVKSLVKTWVKCRGSGRRPGSRWIAPSASIRGRWKGHQTDVLQSENPTGANWSNWSKSGRFSLLRSTPY